MGSLEISKDPLTGLARKLRLSPTLEINELVQEQRNQGKKVVHLGFGEATFPIQKDVLAAHRNASDMSSYLPVTGLMSLREVSHRLQDQCHLEMRSDSFFTVNCSFSDSSFKYSHQTTTSRGCTRLKTTSLCTFWYLRWRCTSTTTILGQLWTTGYACRKAFVLGWNRCTWSSHSHRFVALASVSLPSSKQGTSN